MYRRSFSKINSVPTRIVANSRTERTAYTANRLPRERDAARVSRSSQSAVENTAATAVMSAKYRIQTPAKQMSTKASRKQQNAASIKVNSFTLSFFPPRLRAIGDRSRLATA